MEVNVNKVLCFAAIIILNGNIDGVSPASCDVETIYSSKGDLMIGLLLNDCSENGTNLQNTLLNSAIWTMQRLNYLESTPFKLGLQIYQTCSEKDLYSSIFNMYQQDGGSYLLGLVGTKKFPEKVQRLCDVLGVKCKVKVNYWNDMARAVVSLLEFLNWNNNLTVVVPNEYVLKEFNGLTRLKGICVNRAIILDKKKHIELKYLYGHNVVFGDRNHIEYFLNSIYKQAKHENSEFIFIPMDGLPLQELPEDSYLIQPTFLEDSQKYSIGSKIIPTPLLFDIANPLISMISNISSLTSINCNTNNSMSKLDCFADIHAKSLPMRNHISLFEILSALKIEALMNQFSYNIFRVENLTIYKKTNDSSTQKGSPVQTLVLLGNYSMFDQNINIPEPIFESVNLTNASQENCSYVTDCFFNCVNFEFPLSFDHAQEDVLRLKSEAWVFAYLAIAALGCLFCIAIIIFFLVRICKKDIFEGNPTLTILLLLLVICMYGCVVPFALTGGPKFQDLLCTAKSLSTSLSYAATFSLLLSRCIILATISKEVGFMSHASGPVQVFLGTFMFGVQVALSLQLIDNCFEIMHHQCFVCILSYNMILLFLLICTTFFIMKSERNYREGKYFAIAILLVTAVWSLWVPMYYLYRDWGDEILCFGLVGTASALLGCIFIPRTYVMTISVARDKFTSALPALAAATSAIDIYRASAQPIYDCINIAAINASSSALRAVTAQQQPDLYNCPNLPDEFCTPKCETPVGSDKLTRF